MTTTREPRPGVTLLEVLVAIFIMAIGLLALLTLFPLGAMRMAQALKDDRAAQTAVSADGFLRAHWRGSVIAPLTDNTPTGLDPLGLTTHPDPIVWALDDPNLLFQRKSARRSGLSENHYPPPAYRHPILPVAVNIPQTTGFISPTSLVGDTYAPPDNPVINPTVATVPNTAHYVTVALTRTNTAASYPVMIDPLGYLARPATSPEQRWVARDYALRTGAMANFIPIPRRNLSTSTSTATALDPDPNNVNLLPQMLGNTGSGSAVQTCCLIDDFGFQSNGIAGDPANPGGLTRQGRYSWAAIVQRPNNTVTDVVTLKVMVFDGRPPLLASPDDEVVIRGIAITPGVRSLTLSVPNRGADQTPLVRKGGWILDGTIDNASGIRHANFYRIVGVTEEGPDPANPNNTRFALDLETEVRRTDGLPAPYVASIYLFAGLAEVFERPALQPDLVQ
jgi:prepilin-type N-terminal cleavage/methylation domain-containing protein